LKAANHPKNDEEIHRDAKDIASRWIEDVAGGIVGIPLPIGRGGMHKLEEVGIHVTNQTCHGSREKKHMGSDGLKSKSSKLLRLNI